MAEGPIKFPRTPHLLDMGAATRDDLVIDRKDALRIVRQEAIYEEKVDGANLGISFDEDWNCRAQKRGHWITAASEAQYAKLGNWLDVHRTDLAEILGQDRILYGEWLYAQHTVIYDQLPDWFLAFDIYDKKRACFLSRRERDRLLSKTGIYTVRCITKQSFNTLDELEDFLMAQNSSYASDQPVEGMYLRLEKNGQPSKRAKVVRPGFIQAITDSSMHWSKKTLISNTLRPDLWDTAMDMYNAEYGDDPDARDTDNVLKSDLQRGVWLEGVSVAKTLDQISEMVGNNVELPLFLDREIEIITGEEIQGYGPDEVARIHERIDPNGWIVLLKTIGEDCTIEIVFPSASAARTQSGLTPLRFPFNTVDDDLSISAGTLQILVPPRTEADRACMLDTDEDSLEEGTAEVLVLVSALLICQAHTVLDHDPSDSATRRAIDYAEVAGNMLAKMVVDEDGLAERHRLAAGHRSVVMARCAGRLRNFADSREFALKAISLCPSLAPAHFIAAKAHFQMKAFDSAKQCFKETACLLAPQSGQRISAGAEAFLPVFGLMDDLASRSVTNEAVQKGVKASEKRLKEGGDSRGVGKEENSGGCSSSDARDSESCGETPVCSGRVEPPRCYPRTPHLPFSPNVPSDDICLGAECCSAFVGTPVVVTEKLDGGNCCIFRGKVFARTHKHEATHPWFTAVKSIAATVTEILEPDLALFGENMEAIHSIEYDKLTAPFFVFGILDCPCGRWLSCKEVEEIAEAVGIPLAPVSFRGQFSSLEEMNQWMHEQMREPSAMGSSAPKEGFVIRTECAFPAKMFDRHVAKYVREGHVQTDATFRRTWRKARWKG